MGAIFSGDSIKLLKDKLKFFNTARIITGTQNPTSVATEAESGSIMMKQAGSGAANLYMKLDDGTTTNWLQVNTAYTCDYLDPISTSLPNVGGVSVIFDNGSAALNGDLILFSNLLSNNNSIYVISGVGVSIAYTKLTTFSASSAGAIVRFRKGSAYLNQTAFFTGTAFKINDTIRLFDPTNNNTDFVEVSSIKTTTITATTSNFVIFSVNSIGTNNLLIPYSLSGTFGKVAGQLMLSHDGTSVAIADSNATLGTSPISFHADIDTGNIRLLADNAAGTNVNIKYFLWRWSDLTGGPTGIPNYTGALNTSSTAAAGVVGDVQFKGITGNLAANSQFQWDDANVQLDLNGYKIGTLQTLTLLDNQPTPVDIFTHLTSDRRFMVVQYSLERVVLGVVECRIGRLYIVNNSVVASLTDDYTETDDVGVTFSAFVATGVNHFRYITTSNGNDTTFKYHITEWN